ncbi:acyl-ACP--UDP-N-acetylglucosamine O-acyltransferase [Chelativorans sp. AA-79]|uniref:acyl-ACP--UDP-N-acetylglucosamine O-acyltransferase n=1 Tax=Chelativorans sp. AA-79 TaxID=3028735 RepID=UPI0023F832CC|nr:acyl-ACP--UDP-N-acetylglucosamine O-acyltransferase [Chelativorans sp. AA-79]WEX07046.1 acyl-ACP--UDP-N-acetylglucosamine O-acyltransferase [Chelativorans sp. AA-79]
MAETFIHPSAIVEKGAELGAGVRIGPFCHVSSEAVLGDDVELVGHATILGATTLGAGCQLHPTAVVGGTPQNHKHKGGPTALIIGKGCIIREGVTLHRGTDTSRGRTTIGDNCMFMAYSHVAHDCDLGSNVTMANYACLAGHVAVGDGVIISGYAAVHQFVRVGHHAFLAGYAAVVGDVIPFGMAVGDRAKLRGLNVIGMKRSGMARPELMQVRQAYRMLFSEERPLAENIERARGEFAGSAVVMDILDFMAGRERKYFTLPARGRPVGEDDGPDGE